MRHTKHGVLISMGAALVIVGTMTNEGVECPAMRGEDGQLYTLSGLPKNIEIGDKIEITGEPQMISICQQGTTIKIGSIKVVQRSGSGKVWKR